MRHGQDDKVVVFRRARGVLLQNQQLLTVSLSVLMNRLFSETQIPSQRRGDVETRPHPDSYTIAKGPCLLESVIERLPPFADSDSDEDRDLKG